MNEQVYSIRMRASRGGHHISGAERIVGLEHIPLVSGELMHRALGHEKGVPDTVNVSVASLAGREFMRLPPLPVTTIKAEDVKEARDMAIVLLVRAGVSEGAVRSSLDAITGGASPHGSTMRGAMAVDSMSGERLEKDAAQGIRARNVDYAWESLPELVEALVRRGLGDIHVREALALATKVANAPSAVAELCISDDPSYVTGYVASKEHGYVRITPLKESGDPIGGRAFFVDGLAFELERYTEYMRETPVLVEGKLEIR